MDSHSRRVTFLKVALPLVALAILSTLFLVSRQIDPTQSIPFADADLVDRLREQQVTAPVFSGVTSAGDDLSFTAKQILTGNADRTEAQDITANLRFAEGGELTLVADRGAMNLIEDRLDLSGQVRIVSSTGFTMRTHSLQTQLSNVLIVAPAKVEATGPAGDLVADSMQITDQGGATGLQFLFNGGVKLIYQPQTDK